MIKVKNADEVKVLKAEINSMFTAGEFNRMYLQMYGELKTVYRLLARAMINIEDLEKKNKSDISFSGFVNDVSRVITIPH